MRDAEQVRSWRHFAVVGLCLALMYALGVSGLKSHPITQEEWDSIKHLGTSQSGPLNSTGETVQSVIYKSPQDHAPGYFILLNLWSRLAGLDLFSLRLLSVFTGLVALVFAYRLALLTGRAEIAMDAVLFATFIAFVTYYTYTVRMYALLALLAVGVIWSYWKISSAAGYIPRRHWAAFIFVSAAILWVHYFGTVVLLTVGVYHLLFAPKDRRWRQTSLAALVAGLLFLPWLPIFIDGLAGRGVPASDALSIIDSMLALASIYTNGLPFVVPVVAVAAVANYKALSRSQLYILTILLLMVLLLLIGNEFAPLLIARRIRYTIILALPWACALAIALNRIRYWRLFRIPFLVVWIAAYAAYANSDQLLLYTNWLTTSLQKTPPYQDLFYEPGIDIEQSDYIVSFHADARINDRVLWYYGEFMDQWGGLIHIWTNSDGEPKVQSLQSRYSTIEKVAAGIFRAWLVYNPAQTNLAGLSHFTDGFLRYFKTCGRYVDKPESVIELFGPRDIPCELTTAPSTPAIRIQYDNGSELRKLFHEVDSDRLTVYMWWPEVWYRVYAYSLQIFDKDGSKAGPQIDTVITDSGVFIEYLDVSLLSAGEYELKLVLYDVDSYKSQAGTDMGSNHRFQRDVVVGRFSIES